MEGLWEEWERLTRFLESSRVAFARERVLWESLDLADFDGARIATTRDQVTYDVDLDDHLAAVADEEILWGRDPGPLFALTQAAASARLGPEVPMTAGIEDRGKKFLGSNGSSWKNVKGGQAGVVEVAIVRNAVAHGTRRISKSAAERLRKAKAQSNAKTPARLPIQARELPSRRRALRSPGRIGNVSW